MEPDLDTSPKFTVDEGNIILVGNPNAGKSVIFHELTGVYTQVSNYPGTTLDIEHGKFENLTVIDTPGVYGISSFSIEEQITKDILIQTEKVINVVNALHLERELFLTLQLIDMGLPLIVVLNFMDEAENAGVRINVDELSKRLGVKVIPSVAIKGKGMPELKQHIHSITKSTIRYTYKNGHVDLSKIKDQRESLLALEGNPDVLKKYNITDALSPNYVYQKRRERVNAISAGVHESRAAKVRLKNKISSLMIHPVLGFVWLAAVLYLAYQVIGVFVAQTVIEYTEALLMQGYFVPWAANAVQSIGLPVWLNTFLVGEFGVITMPISYVVGLLLPLALSFYFMLAIMEDTGYLPRLAFLIDKWLTRLGLNGKAVIPLILGFGCVTMATITTRMLDTKRERTIASTLLNFTVPCSAQLAVIAAIAAAAGGYMILAFAGTIFSFFVILGTVLNRFMDGKSSSLVLTLPSLQVPGLKNVLLKTYVRTKSFMGEAVVWFFVGALIISVFQMSGIIVLLQNAISPIVTHWLGLPPEASIGYIMGIIRRDFGAAGFYDLGLGSIQLLVALVSITLFVPCIAAILILYKERGTKIATLIWVGTMVTAFIIGGLINYLWVLFNVINV